MKEPETPQGIDRLQAIKRKAACLESKMPCKKTRYPMLWFGSRLDFVTSLLQKKDSPQFQRVIDPNLSRKTSWDCMGSCKSLCLKSGTGLRMNSKCGLRLSRQLSGQLHESNHLCTRPIKILEREIRPRVDPSTKSGMPMEWYVDYHYLSHVGLQSG